MKRVSKRIDGAVVKGYVVDGEWYRTKREAGLKAGARREYRNADASLVQAYLVGKDINSVPMPVLELYIAAVALTPDWSSKGLEKVQQLFMLSKSLPDYTPESARLYCDCSGTESRRLSRALRSIQKCVQPYATEDMYWAYELNWFRKINSESTASYSDGVLGGKNCRIQFALDLIHGEIGGLRSMYRFPDGWGEGWDTGTKYSRDCMVEDGYVDYGTGELVME